MLRGDDRSCRLRVVISDLFGMSRGAEMLTLPSDMRRNLVVQFLFGKVWVCLDIVFRHCGQAGCVHPAFHCEGPANESKDWFEE